MIYNWKHKKSDIRHQKPKIFQKFKNFFRKFFKVFQSPKKIWNGFRTMKEHSKVIFCWLHFFHLCCMGVETNKIIQKNFWKFFKVFQSPKMVWNGFCSMKEHSKVIFCWLPFFNYAVWGSKHTKISNFWQKKSTIFRSAKMVWNGLCTMEEHSKVIFCWLSFLSPMKCRGRNM